MINWLQKTTVTVCVVVSLLLREVRLLIFVIRSLLQTAWEDCFVLAEEVAEGERREKYIS